MTIERYGTISGTVTNASGAPLANATVELDTGQNTTTNATGDYTLTDILPGVQNATASLPGYSNATASVNVPPGGDVTQNFTLAAQNGTITGTVTDASGSPLPNATVEVTATGQNVTTNGTGVYTLPNVQPGVQNVTASLVGYENTSATVTVPPGGSIEQNFTLSATLQSINLTLANATLFVNDLTIATVTAIYGNGSTSNVTGSATIISNNSTIASVAGNTITANADGQVTINATYANETDSAVLTVTTTAPPLVPAAYYGSLTIDGQPAAPGVVLEAEIGGEVRGSITVNTSGQYGGPAAGDPKLEVTGNSSNVGDTVEFYVNGSDFDRTLVNETIAWAEADLQELNLTATTPPATLTGTVTNTSGLPIANATVTTASGATATDGTGAYTLPLPRGNYTVTFDAPAYAPNVTNVTLVSNESTVLNATLTSINGSISGVITDTGGQPLTNATVVINETGQTATTNPAGSYTITEVPPGTYNLTASRTNYTNNSLSGIVVGPGQNVTDANLSLTPLNGTITGTVTGPGGAGLANATVTVASTNQSATTAANGTYTITAVEPGNYTLTAARTGYDTASENVSVLANATVQQNFTLQASVTSINLTLASTDLDVGDVTNATVTASYSNGTTADVTGLGPTLVSTNSSVAEAFAGNMTVLANGSGTASITTTYEGQSDSENVSVSAAAPPPPPPPPPPTGGGGGGGGPGTLPGEAEFVIIDASVSNETVVINETVTIEALIENVGDASGEFTAELEINGSVVDQREISVDDGDTQTVTFTTQFAEVGKYHIAVSGVEAGVVTVIDGVAVTDAWLDQTEVTPGTTVGIGATVSNMRSEPVNHTVVPTIDGEVVEERSVALAAQEDRELSFTHAFEEEGEYTVEVGGTHAGTVIVTEDTFGFILLLFVLVLLIGLFAFLASELIPRYRAGEPPIRSGRVPTRLGGLRLPVGCRRANPASADRRPLELPGLPHRAARSRRCGRRADGGIHPGLQRGSRRYGCSRPRSHWIGPLQGC
ncbi:MAG: carboxypeptidase-like regulatory domain-containing protein [Natrialbaceae archaeon]|nr:carboxypeptidase-like regulatory domain-containing protein [Natrialbaceae archaeon]